MKIILRDFNSHTDSGILFGTWPKSVYYSGVNVDKYCEKRKWFEDFHLYMKNLIPESEISIACMQDTPEVILAYSIVSGRTLQFVYVKETFRKQAIASLLIKHNKQIREVNMGFVTKIGQSILEDHPNLFKEGTKHELYPRKTP